MAQRTVYVLGGTGFVGKWLVNRLCSAGLRVRVPARHPQRVRELQLLPSVDILLTEVFDQPTLERQVSGCDAAVNLVGILNEKGRDGSGFHRVHVELPLRLATACQQQGVRRLLHMSALNADAQEGTSHYLRSKGEAERELHALAGLDVTSFRPSVIFGPGDSFFNRFAALLKITPLAFPLACPNARFAPIYVDDVVQAFVNALDEPRTLGKRYDLCGPEVFTLKQLVAYTAQQIGARRWIIGFGDLLSRLQAGMLEFAPGKPMSMDNYRSTQMDSVCQGPIAPELNITPTAIDSVVPQYLGALNRNARCDAWRRYAGR